MQVELAPKVKRDLRKELRKAGTREIGGMLFAEQLAPGNFRIVDLSLDSQSGSSASFLREPEAHEKALSEFFSKTDFEYRRFNYLGEWHSHPTFSVAPSEKDIHTMTQLVEDNHGHISFAVLLVVRLRLWMWIDYSLTIFSSGHPPQKSKFAG